MQIKIRQYHNKSQGLTITATTIGTETSWNEHSPINDKKINSNQAKETICESGWVRLETFIIEI